MKKFIALLLTIVLLAAPLGMSAYAETNYDDLVAPCYTYVDIISAGISEGVLGFVNCTSDFVSFENNKTFVLTCYLQRTDGERVRLQRFR